MRKLTDDELAFASTKGGIHPVDGNGCPCECWECQQLRSIALELRGYRDTEGTNVACFDKVLAERDALRAELAIAGPLLAVVAIMDADQCIGEMKVFRYSMPSIAPLFIEGENDALYLQEAANRFVDGKFGKEMP